MAAYLVVDLDITDAPAFEEYRRLVSPVIANFGGRYLVRGGAGELLEGTTQPNRTVILEFPSMERLHAFYDSPEYAPLKQMRMDAARSTLLAVEGV